MPPRGPAPTPLPIEIREGQPSDGDALRGLWDRLGMGSAGDDDASLATMARRNPGLLLVATAGGEIVGSALGGWDGRRGWIYHVATSPAHRRLGIARELVARIEEALRALGCPKVNVMVLDENAEGVAFWAALGYRTLPARQYGRRLTQPSTISDKEVRPMSPITPCLWFDGRAEEAAAFYVSLFPDSRIDSVSRAPADNPSTPAGQVLLVSFTLGGRPFTALNGGPQFPFTEAVSFQVDCADQAEVDRYWETLVEGGGEHSMCGWLKDRFGVSWQVIPRQLGDYLGGSDPAGAERAMQALLQMRKLDIEQLRIAYEGV